MAVSIQQPVSVTAGTSGAFDVLLINVCDLDVVIGGFNFELVSVSASRRRAPPPSLSLAAVTLNAGIEKPQGAENSGEERRAGQLWSAQNLREACIYLSRTTATFAQARLATVPLPSVNSTVRFAATLLQAWVSPAGQRTSMRSTSSELPSPK
jgi:hypothetical protein